MNALQNKTKAHLGLILANLVWAMNYPFYKMIMPQYMSPYALATLAVSIAAILALLSFFFVPVERVQRKGDIVKFIGAAVLMGVAKKLFLMVGIQHTSPIDASIIATLGPILVLVISVFFLIDRFTPMKIVGMVISSGRRARGDSQQQRHDGGDGQTGRRRDRLPRHRQFVVLDGMAQRPDHALQTDHPVALDVSAGRADAASVRTELGDPYRFRRHPAAHLVGNRLRRPAPEFRPNYLLIFVHYVKPTISSVYFYLQPVIATGLSVALGMDKLSWDRGLASIAVFVGVLLVVNAYKNHPSAPRHGGE
ncbi:MAG: DMT family transporter [Alistipes sp.]